jgi:hypothetical protein
MGEFSYAQPDYQSGYGYEAAPAGGAPAPSGDYGAHGAYGYQDEVQSLVPEGVPMLGAILMEMRVLSPETLQQAMRKQAETGDSFAQVVLDGGWAAPDQLLQALQQRAAYR